MKLLKLTVAIATAVALTNVSAAASITTASGPKALLTVNANCAFSSTLNDLNFGSVTPVIGGSNLANVGTTSVNVRCTNTTASTAITVVKAANLSGATPIPYSAAVTPTAITGTGMGSGQDKTLTVTGSILVADYENATPGNYQDTTFAVKVDY